MKFEKRIFEKQVTSSKIDIICLDFFPFYKSLTIISTYCEFLKLLMIKMFGLR
jgi:hypothetical protein